MSGLPAQSNPLIGIRKLCLASVLLLGIFCTPGLALAQELVLNNLVLDNVGGVIRLRFGVEVRLSETLADLLAQGAELGLSCRAQLSQRREYIWNQPVSKAEELGVLSLGNSGEYQIRQAGQESVLSGQDLSSLMRQAWGEIVLDLGSWKNLRRGNNYTVYLEIRLGRQNVTPWVRKALFFWTWDLASPVRYQLDFSY